jgi:hypothetical protein
MIAIPPKYAVSQVIGSIKGASAMPSKAPGFAGGYLQSRLDSNPASLTGVASYPVPYAGAPVLPLSADTALGGATRVSFRPACLTSSG